MRIEEIDELVWAQVLALLENPELIKAEIERRLTTLRAEHPASHRRDRLQRDLVRAQNALRRLIDGYQEQLITFEELRARTPALRKRETTLGAELDALGAELHDAETYLKLTETLDAFVHDCQPTPRTSRSSSADRSCDSSCARSSSATTTSLSATQYRSPPTTNQPVRYCIHRVKALRKAIRNVFGGAPIQRCVRHYADFLVMPTFLSDPIGQAVVAV